MAERKVESLCFPAGSASSPVGDLLTAKLREGVQKVLAAAIEEGVAGYVAARRRLRDPDGHRQVGRNGHLPTRNILTSVGPPDVTCALHRNLVT